ncbi:F-box protein SKIP22 [Raphanus sativus]|uniref:F-box protein SKIP22-like n=1 Tax=Raphanus sativus TaxID=3726 RepID=A0A6J0KL27_RAPSA|nr:F-box protein SKIP22-like [Raphanus sativus]KAJ4879688.1 F-box protein SKIP22 [Raphanus sativus]
MNEVFGTTSFDEEFRMFESILKKFPFVRSASAEAHQALTPSDDDSELTTLATSVHAVMLESGFVLFDPDDKLSFSKELLSVSLRYTLPEVAESVTVTVTFQSLSDRVVVYGSLDGNVRRVCLDKDTLKSGGKEGSNREVFMWWRTVKDGLVTPLLIGLCDKSGLELPPCFTSLPTELKVKIVESLTGASLAKMACVCRETRRMASGNDLWRRKIWEEARHLLLGSGDRGEVVDWKAKFACFWVHYRQKLSPVVQHERETLTDVDMAMSIYHMLHSTCFPRDHLNGSVGIHRGLQRLGRRCFSPGCNLGGGN